MKENGRSMVEMLGVLAVIGVLSIGGIAGYRTAMDMHDANEIINDVNKRAVMTATNIAGSGAKGKNESYYTDLGATNPLGKTVDIVSNGDGTFNVEVAGITTGACKQIVNKDWDVPMYIGDTKVTGTDDCTGNDIQIAFMFADDLNIGTVVAGGNIGSTPTFDPSTYQECDSHVDCGDGLCYYGRCIAAEVRCDQDSDCAAGEYCLAYECVLANCTSDEDCTSEAKPYCLTVSDTSQNMCVECTENAQCGDGYYCGGGMVSCVETSVNRCMRADVASTYTASDGKTYVLSKHEMTWWDAENFCAVLGKTLIPSDVLISQGQDAFEESDMGDLYTLDGFEGIETADDTAVFSRELYIGLGVPNPDYVWTMTEAPSLFTSTACEFYFVDLSSGMLDGCFRADAGARALCWDGADTYNPDDYPKIEPELGLEETTGFETTTPETTSR